MKKFFYESINRLLSFGFSITRLSMNFDFLNKLAVYDTGHDLIRIGSENDGGYLVPNILDEIDICVSLGVGVDSKGNFKTSFEDQLVNYGIESILFDHSVNYTGSHKFTKKFVNSYNDNENITLDKVINSIPKEKNILLQIDVEGGEINILHSIKNEELKKAKILILEFHNFTNIITKRNSKIILDILDKILKNFTVCHLHPNNKGGYLYMKNIKIPNTLEITFINNELVKFKKVINYKLPHKLDNPNFPKYPDIYLNEKFYKTNKND